MTQSIQNSSFVLINCALLWFVYLQIDLYVDTARPIVDKVLEGYNGTILAYGSFLCQKSIFPIKNWSRIIN